jgi:hypothetical protein
MAKHPSHDRTFQPSGDSSSSYGDGGFYFTQPVGAGGGYADGGFFFTQPVGAGGGYAGPPRAARRASGFIHPAYAGTGGYGVAPKVGAVNLKNLSAGGVKGAKSVPGTGASASDKTGTGIADKPATKKAAATASAATIKRFEDAAVALGEATFWFNYWDRAKRATGASFSATSVKAAADTAYDKALKAYQTAEQELLAGLPPFPVQTTGKLAGMPTGDAYKALKDYASSLIEAGDLKQAFRNVKVGKNGKVERKADQKVVDAILGSVRDAMYKKVFTSTSKGTEVWKLARYDAKPFLSSLYVFVMGDPMSEWALPRTTAAGNWEQMYWSPTEKKPQNVNVDISSDYAINFSTANDSRNDTDLHTNPERVKVGKAYTSWELLGKYYKKDDYFNALAQKRADYEARQKGSTARIESARKNWESARKTFVETARTAEQLTIEQQNNALTANNKATQTEAAFDKARDAAASALSARQGAEGAALIADVAKVQEYAAASSLAATQARGHSDEALRLAQEVTSLATRAGGLAAAAKERADAASVAAERSAGEARDSADAATAQVTVAQSGLAVKQAEDEAKRAAEAKAAQDAAVADANAKAQGAQAAADAAKAAADRAAAGVANGTVSAAEAEAARRKYEELQAVAAAEAAKAGAEQAKADLAKAEAERIEALAAAERDKKDEITKDVFTPGEQEPERLAKPKMVSGDLAPTSEDGFFAKYKTPILVTSLILGGAALAWHLTRNR